MKRHIKRRGDNKKQTTQKQTQTTNKYKHKTLNIYIYIYTKPVTQTIN